MKKISDRVTSNKSKHLLVENEFKKIEKFDAAYFRGKINFDSDGAQNYLVFQGVYKYFEASSVNGIVTVSSWKSKGLYDEKISFVTGFTHPAREYNNAKIKFKFDGIVYRLTPITNNSSIVLENCLFGATKMENTTNPDPDKHKYSDGIGIGFNSKREHTHPDGGMGRNVIFGADMTNSKHASNKTQDVLVLDRDFMQKIDNITVYAEILYSPNFSVENKTFCLSLHYNGDDSYLYVKTLGKDVIKFKAKDEKVQIIHQYPMCLGNISSDFNPKDKYSTGLYGSVYDFSVDYESIANDKILDIHNYLMKKNNLI